jgi:DNA-binding MarR family transcriptional regulator
MARSSSRPTIEPSGSKISTRDEVLGFMRLMWAVDHALQRASKQMNRVIGLTGPQRLVVRLLGKSPGMSAGDLARELHLDPSTLTGILHRLEERRLIARETDPGDARRLRLSLSTKGKQLVIPGTGTIESAVAKALKGRPAREVNAASAVLTAIEQELSAAPDHLRARAKGRRVSR